MEFVSRYVPGGISGDQLSLYDFKPANAGAVKLPRLGRQPEKGLKVVGSYMNPKYPHLASLSLGWQEAPEQLSPHRRGIVREKVWAPW